MDLLGVLVLDLSKLLFFFFTDLFHGLFVLLKESLDFPLDIVFLLSRSLDLVLVLFSHFLQLCLIQLFISLDLSLKFLRLLLLRSLQLIIFGTFLHDIFGLIRIKLLQTVLELLFLCPNFLVEFLSQHILLLDYCVVLLHKLGLIRVVLVF